MLLEDDSSPIYKKKSVPLFKLEETSPFSWGKRGGHLPGGLLMVLNPPTLGFPPFPVLFLPASHRFGCRSVRWLINVWCKTSGIQVDNPSPPLKVKMRCDAESDGESMGEIFGCFFGGGEEIK